MSGYNITYYNIHDKLFLSSNFSTHHDFLKYFAYTDIPEDRVDIEYTVYSCRDIMKFLHKNRDNIIEISHGLYYLVNEDIVISLMNIFGCPISWGLGRILERTKVILSNTQLALTKSPTLRNFLPSIPSVDQYTALTLRMKLLQKNSMFLVAACLKLKTSDEAVLISAWPGMGKTEITLKLMRDGVYCYMSDDLTIIDRDGYAYSFPRPTIRRRRFIFRQGIDPIRRSPNISYDAIHTKSKVKNIYVLEYGEKEKIEHLDLKTILHRLLVIVDTPFVYHSESTIAGYEYVNKNFRTDDLRKTEQEILYEFLKKIPTYTLVRCRKESFIIDTLRQVAKQ